MLTCQQQKKGVLTNQERRKGIRTKEQQKWFFTKSMQKKEILTNKNQKKGILTQLFQWLWSKPQTACIWVAGGRCGFVHGRPQKAAKTAEEEIRDIVEGGVEASGIVSEKELN